MASECHTNTADLCPLCLLSEGSRGRAGLHERLQHAGPRRRVLLRVPSRLHPLPEDLRAAGRQPLAVPLPWLQGGLSGYHALQLVGGTHSGYCVNTHLGDGGVQEGRKEGGKGFVF